MEHVNSCSIGEFRKENGKNTGLDPAKLETIRFVFDRSPKGTIMLDDVGISH
jgi:hypothetical protein